MPDNFYKVADLAGLIAQNPQLSDRLGRYPAFISLMERDDIQQLVKNSDLPPRGIHTRRWANC